MYTKQLKERITISSFLLTSLLTVLNALRVDRSYQDSWILEDVWITVAITIFLYIICISYTKNLKRTAVLTAIMAFILYATPALKYSMTYFSTVDNATHLSMIRTIFSTGYVEQASIYKYTAGFHALAAILSNLSGLNVEFGAKILSPLLGSLTPLAFYMLLKRYRAPLLMAKTTIFLSGLSLPLLYTLNGTSFTAPLFVLVIVFFFLRETEKLITVDLKVSYSILLLILLLTIIIWHPSTSIVVSLILLMSGFFANMFYKKISMLERSSAFTSLGVLTVTCAFSYWMFEADLIWRHFVKNIALALQPDITPALVPTRLFTLSVIEQAYIGAFYHARDGLLLALAIVGIMTFSMLKRSRQFDQLMRTMAVVWLMCAGLLIAILITGFGAQGYRRFLFYIVVISPLLAGYGSWQVIEYINRKFPKFSMHALFTAFCFMVFVISSIQLYPYQPAIPTLPIDNLTTEETPVLWLHQVNTESQRQMLDFATSLLPTSTQVIADYIGYQQSALFGDLATRSKIHRTTTQKQEPAYLLLHVPGTAGAYGEQAEYRSIDAIAAWRTKPNISTVYDNGGSFILFHPENATEAFRLEEEKHD